MFLNLKILNWNSIVERGYIFYMYHINTLNICSNVYLFCYPINNVIFCVMQEEGHLATKLKWLSYTLLFDSKISSPTTIRGFSLKLFISFINSSPVTFSSYDNFIPPA